MSVQINTKNIFYDIPSLPLNAGLLMVRVENNPNETEDMRGAHNRHLSSGQNKERSGTPNIN